MAKHVRLVNIPVVQRDPKGSEMVNLDVFDNLLPFWAHLDTFGPFQTKINLLPHKDKEGFGRGAFEQQIIFCLKWSKRVQTGLKGTHLDHFGMLTSLPCLAILVCFISAFFGTPCSCQLLISQFPFSWANSKFRTP